MSADESDVTASDTGAPPAAAPLLRVVRGNPSTEEVAVLVSLVAAATGSSDGGHLDSEPRNDWGRPEDRLRPVWGAPTSFTNLRW